MLGTTTTPVTPAVQDDAPVYKAENPNHPRKALKNGRHCAVISEDGWMPPGSRSGFGLFCDDTRFLNCLSGTLDGKDMVLLSADISDGFAAEYVYGNSASADIPEQTLLVKRQVVLADGLHERWTVTNYGLNPVHVTMRVQFGADFADMFEVRGSVRPQRGQAATPQVRKNLRSVRLSYRGLDDIRMNTDVAFPGALPTRLTGNTAEFDLHLDRHGETNIEFSVTTAHKKPGERHSAARPRSFAFHARRAQRDYDDWRARGASVTTGNDVFNQLIERSLRDLYMLRLPVSRGMMLAAGIPWFIRGFGRDQAVAGLQSNWLLPELSRDITLALCEYLGEVDDPTTSQKPGKVLHELSLGEMARLKEVPFGPYYGTIDASPLTLLLIDDVIRWTGDRAYASRIWPKVERILAYLDQEVADGGGYLRYGGDKGLANQGRKDSGDSIMYENGDLAKAPIALCEPQGYLYSAWRRMAALADQLGHTDTAEALKEKAADLQIRFQRDFWMKEKQFVALALDGSNVQCQVISSNPGHIFASGILNEAQAKQVASRLMQSDMFCGWGIRTLSSEEQRYNPLSYHNGSVWPHDNSLAAWQMAQLGLTDSVCQVFEALFAVAVTQPDLRLPELFAGTQRSSKVPVRYIVSCIPQAWAAGSMLQLLQSSLSLTPDAANQTLRFSNPAVPSSLGTVTVTNLRVGDATVDLHFANVDGRTTCVVTRRRGKLHVIVES